MKTILNIRTDKETKDQAQKLARELGVPLSVIINVYLRQFVRTGEFTFSLARPMSGELEATIREAEKDFARGGGVSPRFTRSKDAISWLNRKAGDENQVS